MKGASHMTDKQSSKQEILSRLDELERIRELIPNTPEDPTTAAILAAIDVRKKVLRSQLERLT